MESDAIFRTAAFGGFNKSDVIGYIRTFKGTEDKLLAENKTLKEENTRLNEKSVQLEADLSRLQTESAKNENRHNEELLRIQNEYEEKIKAMQNEFDADRSAENKIGSAMLDVRRYADLLLSETCEKIDEIAENADSATEKTLSRMFDLSAGIKAFSDKVNGILGDIIADSEEITKELSSFKGTLKLPFESAVDNMDIPALEE